MLTLSLGRTRLRMTGALQDALDPSRNLTNRADRWIVLFTLQINSKLSRQRNDDFHALDRVDPEIILQIRINGQ
tara:strand:+ start:400 stop:621 length:222 start_codon:yes stop_codon:yes gene_type:complete